MDSAAGARLENVWDYNDIFLKLHLAFMFLVVSGILPKLIDVISRGKYSATLSKYAFREIMWIHGASTFGIMYMLQPHNLRPIGARVGALVGITDNAGTDVVLGGVKYFLVSFLAFILYDLLIVQQFQGKMLAYITLHHIGLFIAIYMGRGWEIHSADPILKQQVQLDSCLFGWLWAIHSFGFILECVFPLVGIHLREGERSATLDHIKHAYSAVSVYWFYQYFNADSQPGVGLNYQTLSLMTMLSGRFLPNARTDFIRRVEFPGMFIILVDNIFFKDEYLHRSIFITVAMLAVWAFHYCAIKKHVPMPDQFFGPEENAELKSFLEAEKEAVQDKEDEDFPMKKFIQKWFEGTKINEKKHNERKKSRKEDENGSSHAKVAGYVDGKHDGKELLDPDSLAHHYPLHYAVIKNDAELLKQTIQKMKIADVDVPLMEWHDLTPLQFGAHFVSHYGVGGRVMLLLLEHGGNPYAKHDGKCTIENLFDVPLGNSQNFFIKYNDVCLKKSPAKVIFSELSAWDKIGMVLKRL